MRGAPSQTIISFLIYVLQSCPLIRESSIASFSSWSSWSLSHQFFSRIPVLFLSRTFFSLTLNFHNLFTSSTDSSLLDIPLLRRRSSSTSLLIAFFHLAVPLFLLLPAVPLRPGRSLSALRRLHPHLPVNPISLLVLLSLLRAAVDLSLLPARRPSSLRSSFFLVCLHRSSYLSPPLLESNSILLRLWRTCCSSRSVAGRPDRPQEVRHYRRHCRNGARAVFARYMGETQKEKKGRIPTAIVGP